MKSLLIPHDNMVSLEDAQKAAAKLDFKIPAGHEEDYIELLSRTDAACRAVLAFEDPKPKPDLQRWPRKDVHLPEKGENPLRAWAWKCDVGDSVSDGLLGGRTVVLKDTICVAGVPLLFGTNAFEDYTPDMDASVVTRILEKGGRITGKAACENFSHGASSSSSPYGPVENPFATGFSCGGSSSGCGGLIAAGAADMGVGGDQGGSIRIPSSLCGLVGLKPTFGLVPYTGILSSEAASDHAGPMARNVLDTALLLEAIAGYDGYDDRQLGAPKPSDVPAYVDQVLAGRAAGVKGMKIGVLKEALELGVLAPAVKKAFLDAVEGLRALGAEVQEISIPLHNVGPSLLHVINKFGSGGTRQGRQVGRRGVYVNDYWQHLLPWDQAKYDKAKYFVSGTAMSSEYGWANFPTAYGRAMNLARKLGEDYDKELATFDAIVMPTTPQPARRHIRPDAGPLDFAKHGPGLTAYTGATNLTGHPALSIPIGLVPCMDEDVLSEADRQIRLPASMMLVGKAWDEATLLRIGDAWEQSVDWKGYVPL